MVLVVLMGSTLLCEMGGTTRPNIDNLRVVATLPHSPFHAPDAQRGTHSAFRWRRYHSCWVGPTASPSGSSWRGKRRDGYPLGARVMRARQQPKGVPHVTIASGARGRLRAFEATLVQAKLDGVTRLDTGETGRHPRRADRPPHMDPAAPLPPPRALPRYRWRRLHRSYPLLASRPPLLPCP